MKRRHLLSPGRPQQTAGPVADTGIYLGQGTLGPVRAGTQHHALILGPPRSGKTTGIITPAVLTHPGPVVVTSTKADIIWFTHQARSRLGRCWWWDPSASLPVPAGLLPLRWSPVDGCGQWDAALARAHTLATAARPNPTGYDTHWIERAEALLAPLLHAAALAHVDLGEMLGWLQRHELATPIAHLRDHNRTRPADLLQGIAVTDPRELSGIFSTADSILAAYRSDASLESAADPNYRPDWFAASTDTIYLVAPSDTQGIHAPLVVALLDVTRGAVYRRRPNPPMLFALDELANIAPLPGLPSILAEGGSQGLVILAALQDLSQARHRWGPAADGFLTLFTHKLVLPGIADIATLNAISTLGGTVDRRQQAVTTTPGFPPRRTTTWTSHPQPRFPPDAIANLAGGLALLISGTRIWRVRLPSSLDETGVYSIRQ